MRRVTAHLCKRCARLYKAKDDADKCCEWLGDIPDTEECWECENCGELVSLEVGNAKDCSL